MLPEQEKYDALSYLVGTQGALLLPHCQAYFGHELRLNN